MHEVLVYLLIAVMIAALLLVLWLFPEPSARNLRTRRYSRRWTSWLETAARSEAFLAEVLTKDERTQLARLGYIEVLSPSVHGRVYRVPQRRGMVDVYDDGVPVTSLCIGPQERLPDASVVLMHKLMIEGNEGEYVRAANKFSIPDPERWEREGGKGEGMYEAFD